MSDLIERYGYERAIRELKAMDDRAIWMISSCLKYREEVRKECLEHRRANNIFEVGDKVVSKEDHELVKTVILISNGLARLKCLQFDHVYPLFNFRHATDEEIKAGKRL
ncbi:MAG: hypothetical protein J6C57_04065 [Paludibacteraceae bacterium]|nr:hypothetical protein [Paludibacteraceae bacterium]